MIFKFTWSLLQVVFLLATSFSFGITRVGNGGVGSARLGFESQLPKDFRDLTLLTQESIRFSKARSAPEFNTGSNYGGARGIGGGFFQTPYIYFEVSPFDRTYPELKSFTAKELDFHFSIEKGWSSLKTAFPCLKTFIAESSTDYTVIVLWGENLGYVMVGEKNPQVLKAMQEFILSTKLLNGDCLWK